MTLSYSFNVFTGALDLINSSGGSSVTGILFIYNEIVSGSGTTFTLGTMPMSMSAHLYLYGQRLTPTADYTISGSTVTLVNSSSAGSLVADYRFSIFPDTVVSANIIQGELVSGSGTVFTLLFTPTAGTEEIYLYGQRLTSGPDYTLAGKKITLTNSTSAGSVLADYLVGTSTYIDSEIVSGSGTSWTLANTPAGAVYLYANGQRLFPGGTDYTISGAIITTVNSFSAGQLLADYTL